MSAGGILRPGDSLERQNEKLRKIVASLMSRVEGDAAAGAAGHANFQTAIALEAKVRARTRDLQSALDELAEANLAITQAREEAETARADLANALEAVREGFALFSADDELTMFNSRFSEMLPDVRSRIGPGLRFPDYARIISESRALIIAKGETRDGWRRARIEAHKRAQSTLTIEIEGERWVQVSERRTPDGGAAILQTDITDMVAMERRARERMVDSQARLVRATLDHVVQGVCIIGADRTIAGANDRLRELLVLPAELTRVGASFRGIVAHVERFGEFIETEQSLALRDWVAGAAGRGPIEIELSRRDGAVLHISGRETPDGGVVITVSDVSVERAAIEEARRANASLETRVAERTAELAAARDAAEKANLSKTRFLAAASHDLLQPLNAAKLFASTLAEGDLDPGQWEVATRVRRALSSVEELLGALLDISKLDTDAALEVSDFPLERIFEPLEAEFGAIAASKGLGFRIRPTTLRVHSDPAHLRRIVQNFASNAIKYTDRGRVLVGARLRGDSVRIDVIDTGSGIPADGLERIWQEFHRLRPTGSEASPGMGLGLAIVDRAARILGHEVAVESAPGLGSRFSITAPLAEGAGVDAEPDAELLALVVDADAARRAALLASLEGFGVSALEAGGRGEAQAALHELGVSVDLVVAGCDSAGRDATQAFLMGLKASGAAGAAAIICPDWTGESAAEARRAGVAALPMPVRPSQLRALLPTAGQADGSG